MEIKENLQFFVETQNSARDKRKRLYALYNHILDAFVDASENTKLYFGTLFSRMSYVLSDTNCSGKTKFHLHHFRIESEKAMSDDSIEISEVLIEEGIWAFASYLETTSRGNYLRELKLNHFSPNDKPEGAKQVKTFIRHVNVVAIGSGESINRLRIIDTISPEEEKVLKLGVVGRNDIFSRDIKAAISLSGFPFNLSLVDVEVDESGAYAPKFIIVEPDFLIDVSTVADCFRDQKSPARLSLLKKFMTVENAVPIMLGHISNSFLDTLIHQPEATFEEVFPKVFQLNPLGFSCMDNDSIKQIMGSARNHFENLQNVVQEGFGAEQIKREECLIEPSFYSPAFGIQGRLDLFHQASDSEKAYIIELKSGKVFMPNNYGLNATHYAQTLLYDLMLRSVSDFKKRPRSYILYSSQPNRTLRFAPPVDSLQKESIHARNQIYLMELQMQKLGVGPEMDLFQQLSLKYFLGAKGFLKRDVELFENVYANLSLLERKYATLFTGFISRELALSKVGEAGIDRVNGLASLWLDTLQQKSQKFSVFSFLTLVDMSTQQDDTTVTLMINIDQAYLTNFRKGDIAVLYPAISTDQPVLHTRIYKCTILEIGPTTVKVKLRNKQIHETEILKEKSWHLEHDVLDSGSRAQFRSLYKWMQMDAIQRAIFLGVSPPGRQAFEISIPIYPGLHAEQQKIFEHMLRAKDRYLLWGPPGTGKTSVMIKHAVEYLLEHSKQNILLMAYTNRAVDEICSAVESIGEEAMEAYTRIGSNIGTNEKYQSKLLQNQTKSMTNRMQIRALIDQKRVVISTVSSVLGKTEIFQLKKFDVAIIDEASQILEPMLAGLIPMFQKTILIGDHKQLPAVVTQKEIFSKTEDETLKRIDLVNMRDSYFERMYRLSQHKNWNWSFGLLSVQGRMHQDIMEFANEHFYAHNLQTMQDWQMEKNVRTDIAIYGDDQRMMFIQCAIEDEEKYAKINKAEALKTAEITASLIQKYDEQSLEWSSSTLGIIVPFRAQLAVIRQALLNMKIDPDMVTVDTVERYQGSARDIIVLSTTANRYSQMDSIISKNGEGIDRKLNVAMTRARHQFIMLGDAEVLHYNDVYGDFVEKYSER